MRSMSNMGLARSRTITLLVALATLASNVLSSVLFSQLPDDPYHLASNFWWYLHFANVLSVFGFIGSLRQHALSVAIFSNYLLLDTILCAIPRFLILGLFRSLSTTICASPPPSPFSSSSSIQQYPATTTDTAAPNTPSSQWERLTSTWTPEGCFHIIQLIQLALGAGLVAGTILQFVGALYVREYARGLYIRDVREENSVAAMAWRQQRQRWLLPAAVDQPYGDEIEDEEKL